MTRIPLALATLTLTLSAPASTSAQELSRRPYPQLVAPDALTIVWRTAEPTLPRVLYGTAPDQLDQEVVGGEAATHHELRLTGLAPDTRYYYAVGTPEATLAQGPQLYVRTAPVPGQRRRFRAWVVGDSGTGGTAQAAVRDAMLQAAKDYPPDIFLHMGDMAYSDGTATEFQENFYDVYADILEHTVCWPTLGNHEGGSSDSDTESGPYYDGYVLPRQGEAGGLPSGTEAYYSFDWADVHFVVLDSHDSPREPEGAMLQWLEADLAATDQRWIIAYWHHPPYTKGTHDSDVEGQHIEMRENALPILEAAGVDLVLGGHSHTYERSWLVDGAYDTPTTAAGHIVDGGNGELAGDGPYHKAERTPHAGAVYVVAGHGGKSAAQEDGLHPLMVRTQPHFGSCLLDVDGPVLRLTNIRMDGALIDRFTLIKSDTPALVLAHPDGSEWPIEVGSEVEIRWTTSGDTSVNAVDLSWSPDGGDSWLPIAMGVPNTGSHTWTAPDAPTEAALVRVADAALPQRFDVSDSPFALQVGAPVNHPPEIAATLANSSEPGYQIALLFTATDADDDPLHYWSDDAPAGAFLSSYGLFQWSPPLELEGLVTFEVHVHDSRGGRATQAVTLTIGEPPPEPEAEPEPDAEAGPEAAPDAAPEAEPEAAPEAAPEAEPEAEPIPVGDGDGEGSCGGAGGQAPTWLALLLLLLLRARGRRAPAATTTGRSRTRPAR